ncbi:MAG: hypothetical protein OXC03_01140 [Flavobacteriaceae bacterium]|nr:hypothetical protein [Flavobacteriaceae bacterium]
MVSSHIIPIISIIGGFAIAIIIISLSIYTEHIRKMKMIEKGMVPHEKEKEGFDYSKGKGIRFGALLIGVSLGLLAGAFIGRFLFGQSDWLAYFIGASLFGGLSLLLVSLYQK